MSRGVLERFLKRAKDDFLNNEHIKTIANPRCISTVTNPHSSSYFLGKHGVNENGDQVIGAQNSQNTADKIAINHYLVKSKEEFIIKKDRGKADLTDLRDMSDFYIHDQNEVYDDGILKYREARKLAERNNSRGGGMDIQSINQRRLNALTHTLSPFI